MKKIARALLSVSDKAGIEDFARALADRGIELLSTGGTAHLLDQAGVPVTEVSNYTGFPEIMDGRVKTLHPKVHGAILGRRGQDDAIANEQGIEYIDLVAVNLYPFTQTIAKPDCDLPMAIENIDIGGPTMVRASAKNHKHVAIIVDPADYVRVLADIEQNNGIVSDVLRFELACKAFAHTAAYDSAISTYLMQQRTGDQFPEELFLNFDRQQQLRYGENPHQNAAFYVERGDKQASVSTANQLQGKELSFNNIADTDAALECVKQFDEPACVIVKHANPCGVAQATSLMQAYDLAYQTDPTSAFGGIIAFNQKLDATTASAIVERQFVEVVIAPEYDQAALDAFAAKKNVRVLACGYWDNESTGTDYKRVAGGLLVQDSDSKKVELDELKVVSKRQPSADEMQDLLFAWRVAKFVKSNAIVYANKQQTIGVGAGQMSRVYSAKIAGIKAGDENLTVAGSVMASDAFFPFRDGIDAAAEVGITAVIQPGGSMRDEEVIAAADEHDMAMVFTGIRHFRH